MPIYRQNTEIGRGGFAIVYVGEDQDNGQQYAWKELQHDRLSDEDRSRFIREVKIQSVLQHSNIVPILAARIDSEPFVIILPLAQMNLRRAINENQINNPIPIFEQICEGVNHAHMNGMIHRDLKPENILLFRDGSWKVSDFGLGKRITKESIAITVTGNIGGTPAYSAPEQYQCLRDVCPKADIFSLGKILYELYTKEIPLNLNLRHPSLPSSIRYIVERSCNSEPSSRYPSVTELLNDFRLATLQQQTTVNPNYALEELFKTALESGTINNNVLTTLDTIFSSQSGDAAFYIQQFVRIPMPLLHAFITQKQGRFMLFLEEYDKHINTDLPFSYTDTIANFYYNILSITGDADVFRLICTRLMLMGYSHNRFHVRYVLSNVLRQLQDPGLIMIARDIITRNQQAALWNKEECCQGGLPQMLRDAFQQIG